MPRPIWWSDASGHVAKSLRTLYDEADAVAPHRHTDDDGTIGDARHKAETTSDHNQDQNGIVHALDITHDPANGADCNLILQHLLAGKDQRIQYLIWNRKIYNKDIKNWAGRAYNGTDPHTGHIHVSVIGRNSSPPNQLCEERTPWGIATALPTQPTPAPVPGAGSGKAGCYGWFDGKSHWEDDGDKAGSAALQVADIHQGHAFFSRATLGKWFYVRKRGATRWALSQQTDIGPGPQTGRSLDVHARLADALGYTQDNFPTDTVWEWSPAPPPAGTEHMTPQQQAAAYTAIQFVSQEPPVTEPPPHPVPVPIPVPPPSGGGSASGFDPSALASFLQAASLLLTKIAENQAKQPQQPSGSNMFGSVTLGSLVTLLVGKAPVWSAALLGVQQLLVSLGTMGAAFPVQGADTTTTGKVVGTTLVTTLLTGAFNWAHNGLQALIGLARPSTGAKP